jgi:putative oxidoreductase
MNGAGEAKLIFPGLAGIYAQWREIAYALVRVVIGYILLMHGWGKINTGIVGISGSMAKYGLEPSGLFAGSAMILETVGAVCIIIGLFTRFFAAALAIEPLFARSCYWQGTLKLITAGGRDADHHHGRGEAGG